jgi:hypothetical protein
MEPYSSLAMQPEMELLCIAVEENNTETYCVRLLGR